MENLYIRAFEKYGAALAMLYPTQLAALQDALEMYEETGKARLPDDNFTRLAFIMIVCDLRNQGNKKGQRTRKRNAIENQKERGED